MSSDPRLNDKRSPADGTVVRASLGGSVLGFAMDPTNLAAGSNFDVVNPWVNVLTSSKWQLATDQYFAGSWSLKATGSATASSARLDRTIAVRAGDVLYCELQARRDSSFNGDGDVNTKLRIGDDVAGTNLGGIPLGVSYLTSADNWSLKSGIIVIPAGVTRINATLNADHTAGTLWVDNIVIRRGIPARQVIPEFTSIATASGTTSLSMYSTPVIQFTGTQNQTVSLLSTVLAGQPFTIINDSTGTLTVNSSAGNLVTTVPSGHTAKVIALQDTPTTNSHWRAALSTATAESAEATASTVAVRDANANLLADAFVPSAVSTTAAAGTTTLTADSAEVQIITYGTGAQTFVLPSTGVVKGRRFLVINNGASTSTVQASDTSQIIPVPNGQSATVTALQDTPTASTHWHTACGLGNNLNGRYTATSGSVALRDGNANLLADNFIPTATSTATGSGGGTTTLTIDSAQVQEFTGSTTQTVKLPTTSITVGQTYTVVNNSSGVVTVQSSGANTITTVAGGAAATFMAQVATPTTAANWRYLAWT